MFLEIRLYTELTTEKSQDFLAAMMETNWWVKMKTRYPNPHSLSIILLWAIILVYCWDGKRHYTAAMGCVYMWCVCMLVCVYVCVHIMCVLCVDVYLCVCWYVCVCVCSICVYVYVCVYLYACMCACVYMCVLVCVYVCVHVSVYRYVCACVCVCMCTMPITVILEAEGHVAFSVVFHFVFWDRVSHWAQILLFS